LKFATPRLILRIVDRIIDRAVTTILNVTSEYGIGMDWYFLTHSIMDSLIPKTVMKIRAQRIATYSTISMIF
jgi:hypothetical protein